MITSKIDALLIGKPKPFRDDGTMSAFDRQPAAGPIMLTATGFVGDQVADEQVHGGRDKAVHLYPAEHYHYWREKLPGHASLDKSGAFGENITASGLTEDTVKIGDQFRMGGAVLEVSHGRQPCWKIDHHMGINGLSAQFVKTGKSGLYFRVIEEGEVAAGDEIMQVHASRHEWTVERVFRLLIGGGHKRDGGEEALKQLAELSTLAMVWRDRAINLAG